MRTIPNTTEFVQFAVDSLLDKGNLVVQQGNQWKLKEGVFTNIPGFNINETYPSREKLREKVIDLLVTHYQSQSGVRTA